MQIKIEASLLVVDKNGDCSEANVKVLTVRAKTAPVRFVLVSMIVAMISGRRTHERIITRHRSARIAPLLREAGLIRTARLA